MALTVDVLRHHRARLQEYRKELSNASKTRAGAKPRPSSSSSSQSRRQSLSQSVDRDREQEQGVEEGQVHDQPQYGLVVDLGFVDDPMLAKVISWAMMKYMVRDIVTIDFTILLFPLQLCTMIKYSYIYIYIYLTLLYSLNIFRIIE